jgi:hypothetical protein
MQDSTYLCKLPENTGIKIIVIVILASTKFQKKCSISESILKRKMIERACNKYKKSIQAFKCEYIMMTTDPNNDHI